MSRVAKLFVIDRKGINLRRGLVATAVLLVPFLALAVWGSEKYWLSVSFGALFVGLSDPGGSYRVRFRTMAAVGLIGGLLTALGFGIGGGPWPILLVIAFSLTFLSGLAIKFGAHTYTAALMLLSWFLVAISVPAGEHLSPAHSGWWQQALAWLVGAAGWIAITAIAWLLRGRKAQASNFPEIPADEGERALTRPVILFSLIRAVAIAIAVAIAFGLHLPNADWMPIATLVAMKTTLGQAALASEQRLAGALIGALVATAFLLTVDGRHALELVIVVAAAFAASFRAANYALYCAAVATVVLIAEDIPHPSNLATEGRRVLFTFLGLGIGIVVLLLAGLLQRRTAKAPPAAAHAD
ncbi:MAG TPA: FUSC family protein [Gaiellaceae bacterium]|nr:FUSC family protein [Gaiellaceae bacterium]